MKTPLFLISLGLGLLAPAAQAIVSMESLHFESPPPGFSGSLSLGMNSAEGNNNISDASLGSRLQWQGEQRTTYLLLNAARGESNDVVNTNERFLHLRHIRGTQNRVAWETFLQGEYDEFARLEFRGLLGGGARLRLWQSDQHGRSYLGLGAFYSEERLIASATTTAEEQEQQLWRENIYWMVKFPFAENILLVNTVYYQPNVDDGRDYRLLDQMALKLGVNEHLSFSLAIEIKKDSQPPIGVEESDKRYQTILEYRF